PATPAFFRAMGMHIRKGRGIDSTDVARSLPVTVISESFARRMWPGQSAIGKHINTGYSGPMISRAIVGVAAETRMTSMTGDAPFTMWVPLEQHTAPEGAVLVVRSTGNPAGGVRDSRRARRLTDARPRRGLSARARARRVRHAGGCYGGICLWARARRRPVRRRADGPGEHRHRGGTPAARGRARDARASPPRRPHESGERASRGVEIEKPSWDRELA